MYLFWCNYKLAKMASMKNLYPLEEFSFFCWTFQNVDKNVSWHSHVLQNRYFMVTSNAIKGCVLRRKKMMCSYQNLSVSCQEMTHLGSGRSGESTHLPSLWPGFNSRTWRQIWIEFLFGSCPCSKGFSVGPLVFLPLQKPTFQIPIWPGNSGQKEPPHGL